MSKIFDNLPKAAQAVVLTAATSALAAAVFHFGVPGVLDSVSSLSAKAASLEKQVARLRAENDKKEAFRQQQTEYLNRIVQLEKQEEILRTIVPDEPRAEEFQGIIYTAGKAAGVRLRTSGAPPRLSPGGDYYEVQFAAHVDGTYEAVIGFFDRLAHHHRIVSVSGFSLELPAGRAIGKYGVLPDESVSVTCVLISYCNYFSPAMP